MCPQAGSPVTQTLISLNSWTPADNYFGSSAQASTPIALAAGQPILLESAHCNGQSVGLQQVAVRMQVPAPQANSLAEVQTVTVSARVQPRTVLLRQQFGAGTGVTAYTITVNAADDTRLDNAGLGLELTFGAASKVVTVPITINGEDIYNAIEVRASQLHSTRLQRSTAPRCRP